MLLLMLIYLFMLITTDVTIDVAVIVHVGTTDVTIDVDVLVHADYY